MVSLAKNYNCNKLCDRFDKTREIPWVSVRVSGQFQVVCRSGCRSTGTERQHGQGDGHQSSRRHVDDPFCYLSNQWPSCQKSSSRKTILRSLFRNARSAKCFWVIVTNEMQYCCCFHGCFLVVGCVICSTPAVECRHLVKAPQPGRDGEETLQMTDEWPFDKISSA